MTIHINWLRAAILASLASLASTLANALGGWDMTLQVLVGFMAADYATGIIVAGVFKRSSKTAAGALSSSVGFQGLLRKSAVLMLVLLAEMLDTAAGSGYIRAAVCFFFIANEGLSILENLGLMGVPYPRFLKNMLEALKERSDGGNN